MKELITVIVPTYNAGNEFNKFCEMLQKQTANIKEVIVVDSSSADDTVRIAQHAGFTVKVIDQCEFGHGKTRQMALEMAETNIVCYNFRSLNIGIWYGNKTGVRFLSPVTRPI